MSLLILARLLTPRLFPALSVEWLRSNAEPVTIAWGTAVGFAVGLTSVGSGSLIAPFLMMMLSAKALPNCRARLE